MSNGSKDNLDRDFDGLEDQVSIEEQADANRPYGEVTSEDMSADDLIADGADLSRDLDENEEGVQPLDESIEVERDEDETIEDRIAQEEPDPFSDIVPPDAGIGAPTQDPRA